MEFGWYLVVERLQYRAYAIHTKLIRTLRRSPLYVLLLPSALRHAFRRRESGKRPPEKRESGVSQAIAFWVERTRTPQSIHKRKTNIRGALIAKAVNPGYSAGRSLTRLLEDWFSINKGVEQITNIEN